MASMTSFGTLPANGDSKNKIETSHQLFMDEIAKKTIKSMKKNQMKLPGAG
jgi:hypothetical protein